MTHEDDEDASQPEECDSCGFQTVNLKDYGRKLLLGRERRHKWLCELCASTHAGSALDYPDQYPDRHTISTICYVGNVILAALKREDR